MVDILKLLQRADEPRKDQADFFKSQIIFWLIGATDGHGKNVSIVLKPEGRYSLAPFYDVLSAQLAFDKRQIPNKKYKLAMAVGSNRHYRILEVVGRHFVQSGKAASLGPAVIRQAISEIFDRSEQASAQALAAMPSDFAHHSHESIAASIAQRLRLLETAFAEL